MLPEWKKRAVESSFHSDMVRRSQERAAMIRAAAQEERMEEATIKKSGSASGDVEFIGQLNSRQESRKAKEEPNILQKLGKFVSSKEKSEKKAAKTFTFHDTLKTTRSKYSGVNPHIDVLGSMFGRRRR